MDGTLVDVESSWASVHSHFGESNADSVDLFQRNAIDDAEFLRRDILLWWKHNREIRVDDLERILEPVPLMPGARELFQVLHARRVRTAIISGGIDILARRIGRELGIDYVLANGFRVDSEGRLTGEGIIRVPIKHKEEALAAVQAQLGVSAEESAAVGNSEIDVGMFRRCKVGIAFVPADPVVIEYATHVVTERDLRRILPHLFPDGGSEISRSSASEP
jgi:phosphoserine phosphatase